MIKLTSSGSFDKTIDFLDRAKDIGDSGELEHYGEIAVSLLEDSTPVDTGITAASWDYDVEDNDGVYDINIYNSNVVDGVNVAVLIQYGHATGTGGYVPSYDYINPAMDEAFDRLCKDIWREVKA